MLCLEFVVPFEIHLIFFRQQRHPAEIGEPENRPDVLDFTREWAISASAQEHTGRVRRSRLGIRLRMINST